MNAESSAPRLDRESPPSRETTNLAPEPLRAMLRVIVAYTAFAALVLVVHANTLDSMLVLPGGQAIHWPYRYWNFVGSPGELNLRSDLAFAGLMVFGIATLVMMFKRPTSSRARPFTMGEALLKVAWRHRRWILVATATALFLWFVWPTPWSYYTVRGEHGETTNLRVNRFTGETQSLGFDGWAKGKIRASGAETQSRFSDSGTSRFGNATSRFGNTPSRF